MFGRKEERGCQLTLLGARWLVWVCLSVVICQSSDGAEGTQAADKQPRDTQAAVGYRLLVEKAYLPPDFDEETFAEVWRVWPRELREQAAAASPEERRQLAFQRYGLTRRPDDSADRPLQYVVDEGGNWTMNCFACHGGTVYGRSVAGAPNNRYALQTLTEEIRKTKLRLGKPLSRMDIGSLVVPLGTTVGRTNAVMFGVGLMHFRNEDLSLRDDVGPPPMTHHDMDAPPWWHFHRRSHIYIDGFAQRGHRGLMQFMLVKENGPEKFHGWEQDFRAVYDYLMSLRAPKYEGFVDQSLAARGKTVFNQTCARCHGTYGEAGVYPGRMVAWEEVRTDRVRLDALPVAGREKYAHSWFAHHGEPEQQQTVTEPDGYVAPPLDGVWASAPYFHNGSVPTLWHVLFPEQRPRLWRRNTAAMDEDKVGLEIVTAERIPLTQTDVAERREWFDTSQFGKSAVGHDFADELTVDERQAVLEYLKTL